VGLLLSFPIPLSVVREIRMLASRGRRLRSQRWRRPGLEEAFLRDAGLRRTNHPHLGALPRMVLLALQAWDRTDYVDFPSEHGRRAANRFARAIGLKRS